MSESIELDPYAEYIERMEYYYSKAQEMMSIPLAAAELRIPIEDVEEAVELQRQGAFKKETNE